MDKDLIKRWEQLAQTLQADTARLRRLAQARMAGLAGCGALLLIAVASMFMQAPSGVVIVLGLLAAGAGAAGVLAARQSAALQRRADACQDELTGIVEAVERHEKAPRTPLAIGFANLIGPGFNELVMQDAKALGPLFMRSRVGKPHQIPSAEVLFVYAHLNEDGTLRGPKPVGVRQIVQATHAAIIVLASPNSPESIRNAVGLRGPKSANLVFTLDRNGDGFARFFRELFEKMQAGQDMLGAWAALAPQHPEANPLYAPSTMLVAEGGKIAFPRD
ncbi:MAG: hypothetical protein EKK53_09095 [Burkholderiales bacterium]|nr:MAG: hypothetical protein EKK53_09095 [Burkholderiales bacterium]